MTTKPFPKEPDNIACEICLEELVNPESYNQEADEYVQHYCGIECYSMWKSKDEETAEST